MTVAVLPAGEDCVLSVVTPGAGGYGPPRERDAARIAEDLRSGKYSAEYLREHYPAQAEDEAPPD